MSKQQQDQIVRFQREVAAKAFELNLFDLPDDQLLEFGKHLEPGGRPRADCLDCGLGAIAMGVYMSRSQANWDNAQKPSTFQADKGGA